MKNTEKTGILYGIGVGPGDPELVTLKAVRIVGECDTVILPAKSKEDCIAYGIMKEACGKIAEKELICMPFVGFPHLYYYGNPRVPARFLTNALEYKKERRQKKDAER